MTKRNIYSQKKYESEKMTASPSIYELLIFDNEKLASQTGEPHLILRRARAGEKVAPPSIAGSAEDNAAEENSAIEPAEGSEQENSADEPVEGSGSDEKKIYPIAEREVIEVSQSEFEHRSKDSEDLVSLDSISSYIESLSHHVPAEVERIVEAIIAQEPEAAEDTDRPDSTQTQEVQVSPEEREPSDSAEKNSDIIEEEAEEIMPEEKKLEPELEENMLEEIEPEEKQLEQPGGEESKVEDSIQEERILEEVESEEKKLEETMPEKEALKENEPQEIVLGAPKVNDPVASDDESSIDMQDGKKGLDLSEIFKSLRKARKKATQKNTSYTKKVEYEDQ